MNKTTLTTIILLALLPLTLSAQEIRDMDIRVEVEQKGNATVTTDWDVTVTSGTEWYIPVENLGSMTVTSLKVSEDGKTFVDEGFDWKSKRSLEQKKGRSGIARTSRGVELCWGQGSLGDHKWRSVHTLTGLVQSMIDYDGFNFQFVNDQMIAGPQHVRVTIVNKTGGPAWTPDNTKVWAFGFKGNIHVVDGAIVAETTKPMKKNNHVTIMVRFDKFMFAPTVTRQMAFASMEKKAKKGSNYNSIQDLQDLGTYGLIGGIAAFILWVLGTLASGNKYKKKLFGTRKIKGWHRDVPLNGNIPAAYYVLNHCHRFFIHNGGEEKNLMSAVFLKWILEGKVTAEQDPRHKRRSCLVLQEDVKLDNDVEKALYEMAIAASRGNMILESGEFEQWARHNFSSVEAWPARAHTKGRRYLIDKGYLTNKDRGTEKGYEPMRQVVEFRQFLKDFTIINQRTVPEVHLWNQYLIYGALFGMADTVARQMQKLYPAEFTRYMEDNIPDATFNLYTLMNITQRLSDAVARAVDAEKSRESGDGGSSSVGGGGGHSGGGHGGGSR